MNICFFAGNMGSSGGTERMTQLLSAALVRNDHYKIFVLTKSNKRIDPFFQLDQSVRYSILDNEKYIKVFSFVKDALLLIRYIKKNQIDILINVDTGMAPLSLIAALFTKVKIITWEHSNFYNNWNSKKFPLIRKFAARFSDSIVVLTNRDFDNYKNNIKKCAPLYVIPNPMQKIDAKYDSNSTTILSVGHLSVLKQFDVALKVAAIVLEKHRDWKWVICGEGPERNKIEELIEQFNLKNQVVLRGTVADLFSEYSSAAIYVMTSKTEGLPMVLLESKAHKLPIISFDIMTGPSDIITNGINGYLIEPYNIEKMADKINRLIEDDALRTSFSNNSQIGIDKFDLNRILEAWENLINSL